MSNIREALRLLTANGGMELTDDAKAAARLLEAALATLQAQPAEEVSDEDILSLGQRNAWRYKYSSDPAHSSTYTFNDVCLVQFARAILALRPQAVPMTDEVKEQALDLLATMFDAYENGVPCHEDNGGGYIGMAFSLDNETFHACADILNAHRPKAHHGITAPAGGEKQA